MESIVLLWPRHSFLPLFSILTPEKDQLLMCRNPYKAESGIKHFHPDFDKAKNIKSYKALNASFQDPGTK
jgi:hypothetical protein